MLGSERLFATGWYLTERRWRLDFAQTTAKIPTEWVMACNDGSAVIKPEHREEPIVELYWRLAQVGYARGWMP